MPLIEIPYQIDDFRLVEKADATSRDFRETYRAEGPEGEAYVTVFNLNHYAGSQPGSDNEEYFIGEIRRSAMLTSPVFPSVLGTGTVDVPYGRRLAWIARAKAEGSTLEQYVLSHGPLPEADAADIATELMSALFELSMNTENGGHFNVHPGNIILSRDSENRFHPRLTGMAYIGGPFNGKTPFTRTQLRTSYRAPETFKGLLSHLSDQWSVALVCGFMLLGHHPWDLSDNDTGNDPQSFLRSLRVVRPELRSFSALSPAWQKMLTKATDRKREMRFGNIRLMASALSDMSGRSEDTSSDRKPADNNSSPRLQPVTSKGSAPAGARSANGMKRGGGCLDDVAGMDTLKRTLRRNFVDILRNRELAGLYSITPPNGILLYGAPGCGKTFIAEKAAQESGLNYKVVNPGDLGSIYIHGSQEKIAQLFEQARKHAPSILILDEFDAIAPARSGSGGEAHNQANEVNELLTHLNNCAEKGVFVIAMTNRPDMIDKAVLRKGRIDEMFYVPLPDNAARRGIFDLELKSRPVADDVNPEELASLTENFTCSDLSYIIKESARNCFDLTVSSGLTEPVPISAGVIKSTLQATTPSLTLADIRFYNRMAERFTSKTDRDTLPPAGFRLGGDTIK